MFKTILSLVTGGASGISTYLIVGALAVAIGAYGGYKITSDAYKADEVSIMKQNEQKYAAQVQKDTQAADQLQEQLNALSQNNQTIVQQVTKVVNKPVYRNVCLDADGLRLANSALAGQAASASGTN